MQVLYLELAEAALEVYASRTVWGFRWGIYGTYEMGADLHMCGICEVYGILTKGK